ncbi:hypothetical protein FGO68_gene9885 [Halteria grandinella]|uniref:UBX domain-containing protein n=1 Tax=Halteria grandinella TaxID=5974 RepID=A0A8J8T2D0_HALGN|nr:hypothetical protein FGO68_gene9885 [Halteria grandinella]
MNKPLLVPTQQSALVSKAQVKQSVEGAVQKGNADLLSSSSKRLQQLEQLNRALKSEAVEKARKIEAMQVENELMRQAASVDFDSKVSEESAEIEKLQRQVKDMKKFLADYGLVWIGKDGSHKPSEDEVAKAKKAAEAPPMASRALPKEIDTEVLTKRIEELNFIAEKQKIVKNKQGLHQFQKTEEVLIFFFKNGLVIKGFPFYAYSSKDAQSVLSDILDGFFPYDLKRKYPDGVPLKPVDCTEEDYNRDSIQSNPNFKNFGDIERDAGVGQSKEEFLSQFPKQIVKNGNIIPIREELEKRFRDTQELDVNKLNSNEPIVIDTEVSKNPGKYSEPDIVTIRVRTETGKRNLIVKLLNTDLISEVYKAVRPYLEKKGTPITLRQNFPNRAYDEKEIKSLKELGLAPSSALVIQAF